MYRWQDADGNWVYSDQPSSSGGDEIVHFDGDINLMKATKSPRVKTETGLSIMPGDIQTAVNAPMQFQEKIDKQHKQLEAVKKQLNHKVKNLSCCGSPGSTQRLIISAGPLTTIVWEWIQWCSGR